MLNDQTTPTAPDLEEVAVDATEASTPDTASAEQLEQLLVLSQAPLSLEDALQQEAERGEDPAPLTAGRLFKQFAGLVALFLGIGLITAAVRHYSDDSKLYLGVALGGSVLFAAGSVVLDPRSRRDGAKGLIRFALLSLLFGLGLGLLVGGILHFTAFPKTGAVLVPLGLALSIGAFVARDGRTLIGKDLMSAGVTFAGLLVWVGVGLGMVAKKLDPAPTPPAAAHGAAAGDHGAASAADHGAAAGDHGAAAGDSHGAAAADSHGAAADGHGKAAADGHGEAAKADAHGAATSGHGETADASHDAAGDHGTPAKATAASHGSEAKADSHGKTGTHATEAKTDGHAAEAKADHGAADGHGAVSSKSHTAEEEDEVTAADVLVPRKKH